MGIPTLKPLDVAADLVLRLLKVLISIVVDECKYLKTTTPKLLKIYQILSLVRVNVLTSGD